MSVKRIAVLGSTGSVGEQTLAVAAAHPDRYAVAALAAGRRVEKLADQVRRFRPRVVSVADAAGADELRARLAGDVPCEIAFGAAGLDAVATADADLVVAALVGAAGLRPTLAAIRAGRDVALANKEVLVMAGALVRREVAARGVTLLPVDSEHSAIFQALAGADRAAIAKLILTASGGPFRTWSEERIARATVEEALRHPNWDMGPKITIDSATLMNKGLEVIEAHHMFDLEYSQIHVLVHPEGTIHALAEFRDGSIRAEMATADMRLPIQLALAWPERLPDGAEPVPLTERPLTFEPVDREAFPAVDLAYRVGGLGSTFPAVMNAANEVAVMAFLEGKIPLTRIVEVVQAVVDEHDAAPLVSIVNIERADHWARQRAAEIIEER